MQTPERTQKTIGSGDRTADRGVKRADTTITGEHARATRRLFEPAEEDLVPRGETETEGEAARARTPQ